MQTQDLFWIFFGGVLGALLHVFVKVRSMHKRLENKTYWQVFGEFWKTDPGHFLITITGLFILVFVAPEVLKHDAEDLPQGIQEIIVWKITKYLKLTSVLLGFCMNSIIMVVFGGTENKIIQKGIAMGLNPDEIIKAIPTRHPSPEENSKP